MITLAEIVDDFLSAYEMPLSKSRRIERIAVRGFRLFWRDSTGTPKEVVLNIQANGTAPMPADMMTLLAIGPINQRGEIASLTEDTLLSLTDSESPDRYSQPQSDTLITGDQIIFSYQDSLVNVPSQSYELLGVGSTGTIGFYKLDWGNRVILFNFKTRLTNVHLSYLGLPQTENGDYFIDPIFAESMIAYIAWQDSVGDKKATLGQRRANKDDFDIQYVNARKAKTPLNPSDIYNQQRRDTREAPKS